jgi:hypothetical protein
MWGKSQQQGCAWYPGMMCTHVVLYDDQRAFWCCGPAVDGTVVTIITGAVRIYGQQTMYHTPT